MSLKTIFYFLGATAILLSMIYYQSKALQQQEKCKQVSLKSTPMELGQILGAPVESQKTAENTIEYYFETSPLMKTRVRATFDSELGVMTEFLCGDIVLVSPISKQ